MCGSEERKPPRENLRDDAIIALDDGLVLKGSALRVVSLGLRRGRVHDGDERLRRGADRPVLSRPDPRPDLPARRQLWRARPPRPALDRAHTSRTGSRCRGWWCSSHVDASQPPRVHPSPSANGCSRSVPAVTGIDTRTLTRRLRERGTMRGWLAPVPTPLDEAKRRARLRSTCGAKCSASWRRANRPSTGRVRPTRPARRRRREGQPRRSLLERGATVIRAPWHADLGLLADEADGVLIGNGPGDPKDLAARRAGTRPAGHGGKPIFGVCLGNQILALAAGGDTYKLPYGHRGVNQPVQDLLTRRCFITSQNHGYAVRDDSLPRGLGALVRQHQRRHQRGDPVARQARLQRAVPSGRAPRAGDTGFLFDDFLRSLR